MNKKISKKIIMAIILVVAICLLTVTPTLAYIDPGTMELYGEDITNPKKSVAEQVLGIVQIIGVAVAMIMLIMLAVKYLMASTNEKAEIKKNATVYIVGAVVLFAASGIIEIIKKFSEKINQAGTESTSTTATPTPTPTESTEGE